MLTAALTTAATLRLISSSALTRSRSEWSMMAISPGLRRLVMFFVRWSTRATATIPGGSPALPRCSSGSFTDGAFIDHGDLAWAEALGDVLRPLVDARDSHDPGRLPSLTPVQQRKLHGRRLHRVPSCQSRNAPTAMLVTTACH